IRVCRSTIYQLVPYTTLFRSPEDTKQFFEYAKEFLEQEYGKDNLLYATVHMDEKTPHMHYGVVPITDDGRLSAKEVVGNKKDFKDRKSTRLNSSHVSISYAVF